MTMTRISRQNSNNKVSPKAMAIVAVGILLATLLYLSDGAKAKKQQSENIELGKKMIMHATSEVTIKKSGQIIPYYHCSAKGTNIQHLVLLHGAKFTKEAWKTSGILKSFCLIPNLSVSAMDLPVSSNREDLEDLLTVMQESKLIELPVALVTPSASGSAITDWMRRGDVSNLPNYIFRWIPVAANSVSAAKDEQVSSLKEVSGFSIFAIYGDRDGPGKLTTERLQKLAGAKTLELEKSGHPCYLDSPDAFVAAVLEDLGLSAT
jgi:hypothetical protein